MFRSVIAVITMLTVAPLSAECLSVENKQIEPKAEETGAGRVAWSAEIVNRCQLPQDALLDIRILDAEGEALYAVRDQTVVGRLGSKKLQRQVYIPAQHMDAIEDIEISLEERERPM